MEDITDPIVDLTVLVVRDTGGASDETGTGLLVTPRLILTALHVACPFGEGRVVPVHGSLKLLVRFEIGGGVMDGVVKPPGQLYAARLVWPPAGSPAGVDFADIALLALDNEGLADGERGLPQRSVDQVKDFIERHKLVTETRRLRLGVAGVRPPLAKFIGFPVAAREILANTIVRNIGRENIERTHAFNGDIAQTEPLGDGLIYIQTNRLTERSQTHPNPLAGVSGAAVYRIDERTGLAEIYGTLNRSLRTEVAVDVLTIAPIPRRPADDVEPDGFWSIVRAPHLDGDEPPDEAGGATETKNKDPHQRARELIHRLDRRKPVKLYLDQFRAKRPRCYLFVFVATNWDGHGSLWRRLQEVSCKRLRDVSTTSDLNWFGLGEDPKADEPLFDLDTFALSTTQITIPSLTGTTARADFLRELAGRICTGATAGLPEDQRIAERLASGASSRLLLFDIGEKQLFDPAGQPREAAVGTVQELMRNLANWATKELTRPSGVTFERDNPLVALLTVIVSGETPDAASERARLATGRVKNLFASEWVIPAGFHCEVFDQQLDEITFSDFRTWCEEHVEAADLTKTIGRKIKPPFVGGTTLFCEIDNAISE